MALAAFLWHVWISAGLSSDQQREMTSVLTDDFTKGRETIGLCCCNSIIFNGFMHSGMNESWENIQGQSWEKIWGLCSKNNSIKLFLWWGCLLAACRLQILEW